MLIDRLIDKIKETDNPSVVGLDTCIDYLPDDVRGKCETLYDAAKYVTDFNFALIDAIKDVVPAVKVQVAYYEMYGVEGMRAFSDTLAYARQQTSNATTSAAPLPLTATPTSARRCSRAARSRRSRATLSPSTAISAATASCRSSPIAKRTTAASSSSSRPQTPAAANCRTG